jgi:hypothetical protein
MRRDAPAAAFRTSFAAAAAGVLLASGAPVSADTVSDVRIAVDARTAGAVEIAYELAWKATEQRTSLRFYLAKELDVVAVESGKGPLGVTAKDVPGTGLRSWEAQLPAKLAAGKSAPLTVRARAASAGRSDLRLDAAGGALLPGSGWFPLTDATSEVGVPHTTTFALPAGQSGVAAGARRADGAWQSEVPARPYAVWGALQSASAEGRVASGVPVTFEVWRPAGSSGTVPDLDVIAGLIRTIEVGVGTARGTGAWKLVDAGISLPAGGSKTVFWDGKAGASGKDAAALLRGRDLAGAVAVAHWTECADFRGDLAGFLSRGIAHFVGDAGFTAWAESGASRAVEAVTIRARRDAFLRVPDRVLAGLPPASPEAGPLLATRGALVAHQLAGSFASDRARWLMHLRNFRDTHVSGIDWPTLRGTFREGLAEQIEPLLLTADLPDFHITAHEAKKTDMGGMRYFVTIENRGKARGWSEITTYDASGAVLYETRIALGAGESKTLRFGDPERIAKVILDPNGVMPQRDLAGESVQVKPAAGGAAPKAAKKAPSYPFAPSGSGARAVRGFRLQLTDASIEGFDGWVIPYASEQGTSGACLIGTGTVTLSPSGAFAAPWTKEMGRATLTFPDAKEMWLRFPLDAWKQIEPQLGEPVGKENLQHVLDRQNWIFGFSFPGFFADRDRAEIPPPGSTVVVFTAAGGEWRGFARVPMPDGKVLERLWDHLQSTTLWELRQ